MKKSILSDDAPVKRVYRSRVRADRAAATRRDIRETATRLFVEQGYVTTTLRQVAEAAGVAERTVYAVFPSKAALFGHCLDVAVGGDERDVAVAEREQVLAALSDPDPWRCLEVSVDFGADLLDRAGGLIMVGVQAAGADPDMAETAAAGERETHAHQLALARHLESLGALRDGVDARTAADVLFALASPYLHHLLRRQRRWSRRRYRTWLLESLTSQLLRDPATEG